MTFRAQALAVVLLAGVVAVSSAFAGSEAKRFTVTSSLDGKRVLPLRIRWIAHPHNAPGSAPGQAASVQYLIDGHPAWTEKEAPYYYGGNDGSYGNWLVTSFLTPGLHTFTVQAITITGRKATDTVKARVVAAPPPPTNLAGTWSRMVTPDDLKKAEPGPPAGRWTFHVTSVGWGGDGTGASTGGDVPGWSGQDRWDVRYLPNGNVVMGPEVVTPAQQSEGFCGIDPLGTWTLVLSADNQSMRLDPVGTDPCSDRVAIMQGTWTRVP